MRNRKFSATEYLKKKYAPKISNKSLELKRLKEELGLVEGDIFALEETHYDLNGVQRR